MLAVVVAMAAAAPARAAVTGLRFGQAVGLHRLAGMSGKRGADQRLQALLARIGRHRQGTAAKWASVQPLSFSTSAANPICRGEKRFLRSFQA